jgi:drug/metabolite transporter (DMT)-like permease
MPRALKAHVLLVLVTFIWGATFVLIKNAIEQDASPLLFNFVRMLLAAVTLAIIFHREILQIKRPVFVAGVLTGIFLWLG